MTDYKAEANIEELLDAAAGYAEAKRKYDAANERASGDWGRENPHADELRRHMQLAMRALEWYVDDRIEKALAAREAGDK